MQIYLRSQHKNDDFKFRTRMPWLGEIFEGKMGQLGADMEKVASMQVLLADNFWENCGYFWTNIDFLAFFLAINGHNSALLSTTRLSCFNVKTNYFISRWKLLYLGYTI